MNDQPQVRVFDPPNTQPRGRTADQPPRVETFPPPDLDTTEQEPQAEQTPARRTRRYKEQP